MTCLPLGRRASRLEGGGSGFQENDDEPWMTALTQHPRKEELSRCVHPERVRPSPVEDLDPLLGLKERDNGITEGRDTFWAAEGH